MFGTVRLLAIFVLLGVALALATSPASAAQYTNVTALEAWSAEANYMSLAGYLRWMTFREQGVWLSMPEAQRIVTQQQMETQ